MRRTADALERLGALDVHQQRRQRDYLVAQLVANGETPGGVRLWLNPRTVDFVRLIARADVPHTVGEALAQRRDLDERARMLDEVATEFAGAGADAQALGGIAHQRATVAAEAQALEVLAGLLDGRFRRARPSALGAIAAEQTKDFGPYVQRARRGERLGLEELNDALGKYPKQMSFRRAVRRQLVEARREAGQDPEVGLLRNPRAQDLVRLLGEAGLPQTPEQVDLAIAQHRADSAERGRAPDAQRLAALTLLRHRLEEAKPDYSLSQLGWAVQLGGGGGTPVLDVVRLYGLGGWAHRIHHPDRAEATSQLFVQGAFACPLLQAGPVKGSKFSGVERGGLGITWKHPSFGDQGTFGMGGVGFIMATSGGAVGFMADPLLPVILPLLLGAGTPALFMLPVFWALRPIVTLHIEHPALAPVAIPLGYALERVRWRLEEAVAPAVDAGRSGWEATKRLFEGSQPPAAEWSPNAGLGWATDSQTAAQGGRAPGDGEATPVATRP